MKRISEVIESVVDLLSTVAPILFMLFLHLLLGEKFTVKAFGLDLPLIMLAMPLEALYIAIMTRVYNLGKTYTQRTQGTLYELQQELDRSEESSVD